MLQSHFITIYEIALVRYFEKLGFLLVVFHFFRASMHNIISHVVVIVCIFVSSIIMCVIII